MELALASLHCRRTAKRWFTLPRSFSVRKLDRRVSRFGRACEPTGYMPQPRMLRYQSKYPLTIYSSGIEKIIAV